jgi:hypothetical protein
MERPFSWPPARQVWVSGWSRAGAPHFPKVLRFRQQCRGAGCGSFGSALFSEDATGWLYPPKEEVPVSHSSMTQGLLIAENAG